MIATIITIVEDGRVLADVLADVDLESLVGRGAIFESPVYGEFRGQVVDTDNGWIVVNFDPPPTSGLGQGEQIQILDKAD